MPEMIDRISYLSQEIGPRPAGTEEEQQAANYIAESFENEIGLPSQIQEFNAPSEGRTVQAVLSGVMVVASVLALLVKILAVPLFVLLVITAVVFFMEETGRPLISRFLSRGVSQNVVAKYVPDEPDRRPRRRKVILVARYDSGKVRPELGPGLVNILPLVNKASVAAMFFVPLLILLRLTLFAQAEGVLAIILNVVTVIALLLVAVPLILKIIHRFSAYNEAANSNAAGVAVMMEAARRMASGTAVKPEKRQDDSDLEPVVHGEEAAWEQGVVPQGASLTYDVQPTESAQPLPPTDSGDSSENAPVTPSVAGAAVASAVAAAAASAPAAASAAAGIPSSSTSVAPVAAEAADQEDDSQPAWFKAAQAKAKKKSTNDAPIRRSRYADALDAAMGSTGEAEEEDLESSIPFASAPEEEVAAARAEATAPAEVDSSLVENPFASYASAAVQAAANAEQAAEPQEYVPASEPEPLPGSMDPVAQFADFNKSLDDISPDLDVAIPSFLDPAKAQRQAQDQQSARAEERSAVSADQDMAEALAADSVQESPLSAADIAPVLSAKTPASPARPKISLPSLSGEFNAIKDRGGLLNSLPAVNVTPSAERAAAPRPSVKDLRTSLPSLSGEITRIKDQVASLTGPVQPIPDVYAPLEEELDQTSAQNQPAVQETDKTVRMDMVSELGDVYEDDPYGDLVAIDDPVEDNADYEPEPKKGGLFSNLFGRFGRKANPAPAPEVASYDDEDEVWLDEADSDHYDPVDREWKGGAFSLKEKLQGKLSRKGAQEQEKASRRSRRRNQTEDVYAPLPEEAQDSDVEEPVLEEEASFQEEQKNEERIQAIRDFHNPYIGTEVWFVALGAELADNAGMNAFIAENRSDLRGAIVIELDSLGAGELSFVESGGILRKAKSSSRMKRYLRRASQVSGVSVKTVESSAVPSTTVFANSHGLIAMHMCGMEKGKPALLGQADDVVENVSLDMLYERADFVMDLVSVI